MTGDIDTEDQQEQKIDSCVGSYTTYGSRLSFFEKGTGKFDNCVWVETSMQHLKVKIVTRRC